MAGIPADKLWIESPGGRYMLGRAHVDSGLMTLLAPGSSPFAPFYFGDYLWSTMTRFVEFHGLEGLRRPQGLS